MNIAWWHRFRHPQGGHPAEERERGRVTLGPGPLVQRDDRADEQVPRAAQHHHERPDRPDPAGDRIGPPAPQPVIDLRLLPGHRRMQAHRTRTCARRTSSGRFAATYRRSDATDTASPRSSRSRWWIVATVTRASSCATM